MLYEEIKPEGFQVIDQVPSAHSIVGPALRVDDGLSYGLGFFETILILEGPCFLTEHVDRINASLMAFGIQRRVSEACLLHLISTHAWQNIVLKIMITEANAIAITRAIPYLEKQYEYGFSLTQSAVIKSAQSAFIRHKSLNYGENIWALKGAKYEGYDDCLFANEFGNITESSLANLFIIEDGQLITPPLSDGLLPGIIRSKLIKSFEVKQESITHERLLKCEGAFLTNSVVGVIRVCAYVGLRVPEHPMIQTIRMKILEEARCSYAI
jgi:4-amino-4-deoxychorismate lyase